MAGPQRIEWRRRPPLSALSNLAWYAVIAVLAVACSWLLFRGEPAQADGGEANPLAALPATLTAIAVIGAVPLVVCAMRRPLVAADHFALLVRPGLGRSLMLPWAAVAEVAVAVVGHDQYLVIKRRSSMRGTGATPGWIDQFPLRRLRGATASAAASWRGYDVAIPMGDFVGGLQSRFAALAAFAPDNVHFKGGADDQPRPRR